MAEAVRWKISDGVMVVTVENPPVNALDHAARQGLLAAVDAAQAPEVKAIVITGAGSSVFAVGEEIAAASASDRVPLLADVLDRIETCGKLVVAALNGQALGGGLELALACHTRIALATARVGFPEVKLGLLPGAGGTQRTSRLCGAAEALKLMLDGAPIDAATAMAMGLLDGVVEEDLLDRAVILARMLINEGKPPSLTRDRREGFRDPQTYAAAIAAARAVERDSRLPAPERIIACVEAAILLPFEAGMAFERAAAEDLETSKPAAGLRHAARAEARAARIPEAGATPRPVGHAGVIGGGVMGSGIATALLGAGLRVTLVEVDEEALARGLSRIDDLHERAVARGQLSDTAREGEWARLAGATAIESLRSADIAIEAVPEDEALEAGIFRDLDRVMRPGAILATNTSCLDIDDLARVTSRPADVVGLRFFSPVQAMPLIEVVAGAQTAPEVVTTGFELARQLRKFAVRVRGGDGFIGDRIFSACGAAADFMLEDGATPAAVDRVMRDFGFPLGPYQVADMAGLDIAWARRQRLADSRDPSARYVAIGDRLCEAGRFGRKTGAGYYRYGEGSRMGAEDPAVTRIIEAERAAKGIVARNFDYDEIRDRCLYAMVNEGAKILSEGVALRPSDIDLVMLMGYGYPRLRGGPMKTADMIGLLAIRNRLRDWAGDEPFWTPSALLDEMIKEGRSFDDMNAD
ncbi:hypothetical protein U879_07195 [Defluviimonas sp. 20V17]|uniref:3-hydroxyacyl-CoA dehydrogenase n=1 Tax=Allgaiera indica TaxID=765699 RepID=A0AAN4UVL4_9RHOB|nr:3-hydroxyacyl-CoA dehydrogenase NAD-binding domain-containing protein [Allgaiera indica]KDB04352.1 hypothetical protein U879_07195 [Defluviimonas sp. 20V17]GHE06269.1 enoyl-CoA hydratase [Allgaiera indica]SDX89728.1 3-hydroxyacyl-CoA dehydrogenase [Allgaiera indica]